MTPHTALRLLLVAILIGIIMRFSGIESKSLWGDEIVSLVFSTGHSLPRRIEAQGVSIHNAEYYRAFLSLAPNYFSQRLISILSVETQPPLYFYLLNLWVHLFGTSEAALRSISALAGVGSIPFLYALGRRLFSAQVGIYSALILSIAPFQIAFSQYNRPYALLTFFSIVSTYVAIRLCQEEGSWKWLLIYSITAILGFYTQYLFVWNLLFHCILVTFYKRNDRRFLLRWMLTQIGVAGAFLLWVPVLLSQIRYWTDKSNHLLVAYWFSEALKWPKVVLCLCRDLLSLLSVGRIQGICPLFRAVERCWVDNILTGIFYIVPIMVLGLCAWHLIKYFRMGFSKERRIPHPWGSCFLWGLCIFGGPLLVDLHGNSSMITNPRYFISASGPCYIAVAMTFCGIANGRLHAWVVSGFFLFLLVSGVLYLQGFSGHLIYEQGSREVARHIDQHTSENDLVLALNPGMDPLDLTYYLESNPDFSRINIPERWQSATDIPTQLENVTTGRKRVWYIDEKIRGALNRGPEMRGHNLTMAWLQTRYGEKRAREFKNINLFLFSRINKDRDHV